LAGDFTGQKVFNRTDGKLYQWTGSAWELVIAEPDTFIASDKIIANTITGGLLATSGIITQSAQINDLVVARAKIQDAAISTAKIGANMVTFPQLAEGSALQIIPRTDTSTKILTSLTVNQSGAPAQVTGYFTISHDNGSGTNSGDWIQFNMRLKAGGTTIAGLNNAFVGDINSPIILVTAQWTATGSTTYSLEFENTGAGAAVNARVIFPRIQFVELKR
jgi:hypothetical protein